jgi:UDP-N-acetylglucosamine acyltransferase
MTIHATAVVDSRAQLGPDVDVGPYSVIGPEVRIGAGTQVGAHAVLEGRVDIGARCRIGHGTLVGGIPQDLKYRAGMPVGVRLGDDTVIREYVTIHRATKPEHDTQVGDHCLVMTAGHVGHDCVIGNHVIVINYAGLSGHVRVGDCATVGGYCGLHPFVRIGTHAYIGGYSKIVQDVPPFVMADGIPATARAVNLIGMRRGGIDGEGRRRVKAAFRLLYRSGLAPGSAAARIKAELGDHPLVAELVMFIETSKRGIVRGGTAPVGDAPGEETAS